MLQKHLPNALTVNSYVTKPRGMRYGSVGINILYCSSFLIFLIICDSIHFDCFYVRGEGMFLYRAVSSPFGLSMRFILHSLAELFILASTLLLREAF